MTDWGANDPIVGSPSGSSAAAVPTWGANDKPVALPQTLIPTQHEPFVSPGAAAMAGNPVQGNTVTAISAGLNAGLADAAKVVPMALGGLFSATGAPASVQAVPFSAVKALSDYADRANAVGHAISPGATTAGNVLSFLPLLAGGEAALPEDAGSALAENAPRLAKVMRGLQRGAPIAAGFGTVAANENAANVINQGGSAPQAEKLFGTSLAANTAANLIPAGAGGGLLARSLVGGAANAVGGTGAQELEHLTAPDFVPAPSVQSALQQGGIGALMSAVLGHGGSTSRVEAKPEVTFGQHDPVAPDLGNPAQTVPPVDNVAQQAATAATARTGSGATAAGLVAKNAAEAGLPPPDVAAHAEAAAAMVKADPNAQIPLHPSTPIDATHSIPLGGGGSTDNSVTFIDKRIPQFVDVPKPDGTLVRVDAHDVIANAHEAPEKTQLDQGKPYADAHNVNANTYEAEYLWQKYGVSHEAFNKVMEPYLAQAEEQGAGAADIPAKLDPKPYVDGGDQQLLQPKADETTPPGLGKVVDDHGKPLTVYHGTASDFTDFADQHAGDASGHATSTLGHFFTPDRAQAEGYARNASGGRPADERVVEAHLAIHHPYTMPLAEAQAIETPAEGRAVREKLQAQGYDGIHLPEQNAWVAFHPEQIRPAGESGADNGYDVGLQKLRVEQIAVPPERLQATQQEMHDAGVEPGSRGKDLTIMQLVDRAYNAGADPKAIAAAFAEPDDATAARKLWELAPTETRDAIAQDSAPPAGSAVRSGSSTSGSAADSGSGQREEPQATAADTGDHPEAEGRPAEPQAAQGVVDHTTRITNEQVNAERAAKQKDALETTQRLSDPEAHAQATAKLAADPEYGKTLARDLLANPRAPSKVEDMVLALDRQRIETELRDSTQQISDAIDAGDTDAEAFARMRQRAADDDSEINDLASHAAGTESGRSLQGRKAAIAEDYSLSSLLNKAKAAKGSRLTDEQRALFEDHAKRIAELEQQLAARDIPRGRRKPVAMGDKKAAMDEFNRIAEGLRKKTAENPRGHCLI